MIRPTNLLILTACLAGQAMAQQSPLGDGTGLQKKEKGLQHSTPGLQRDLQVPGTGTPAPGSYRDLAAEQRFRNAIITGNAPAGMSFRGNAGYKDPKDFGGKLGSDDLFAFRRDSLYSGSAGIGIRGTDAIQYQFALSTGNVSGAASSLSGTLALNRGTAAGESTLARATEVTRQDTGLVTGMLRSSATFESNRSLRPTYLGARQPSVGKYERLFASSLGGVQYQPWDKPSSTPPAANAASPGSATTAFDNTVDRALNPLEQSRFKFAKSLEKPSAKPADDPKNNQITPDALTAIDKRLAEMRDALHPAKPDPRKPATTPANPNPGPAHTLNPLNQETVDAIKNAGGKVDSLLAPAPDKPGIQLPAPTDRYNQYMLEGQTNIKDRRFFDAEERFALALNSRPGDLAAMVGRLHSQIGAGMRVSAALNLRRIITTHPEALANTYDMSLFGGEDRLGAIITGLRAGVAGKLGVSDSALLLAYLSHQRGAAGNADLQVAFDALESAQKALTPSPESDAEARILTLLKEVWKVQ